MPTVDTGRTLSEECPDMANNAITPTMISRETTSDQFTITFILASF